MSPLSRSGRALALAWGLALAPPPASAQEAAPAPEEDLEGPWVGCWDVEVGPWRPAAEPGADTLSLGPPGRVRLEAARVREGSDQRRATVPAGALPTVHPYGAWLADRDAEGDRVRIRWTNGFSGIQAAVRPSEDGLSGTIRSFWDTERPVQEAPIVLVRAGCDTPPVLTEAHQRSLPDSLVLADGTTLRIGAPVPRGSGWVWRRGSVYREGVTAEGLGAVASVRLDAADDGTVRTIVAVLPRGRSLDEVHGDVEGWLGRPSSVAERSGPAGTVATVTWGNRSLELRLSRSLRGGEAGPLRFSLSARRER